MELQYLLAHLVLVWLGGVVYTSNLCRKSDITVTDAKVTIKSFIASLELTTDDIPTSKMVVGCTKGYQMRVDFAWQFQTYEQPGGKTLIEVNCSQLYALDKQQICFQGCSLPSIDNAIITPLPSRSKVGAPYNDRETIQVHCGDELVLSTCRGSVWTNLSQFECLDRNVSARSLTIVLDTTTHMGTEISQIYDMSVAIVSNLQNSDQQLNYVLIPFNDPDFYPPIDSFNGSDLIKHLGFLNSHGASGGMDCPELSLAAIERAISASYPSSHIFVFTDASSKEPERKTNIIREATEKRIKVDFVLTGFCGENQLKDQAIYHEIAEATGGFMVSAVDKSRVKEIESVMEESLKPSERTFYNDLTVNDPDTPVTVQIPCDWGVQRMTITILCKGVVLVALLDDKGNDLRFQRLSSLNDMLTVSLRPSLAEHVEITVSCEERGTAQISANSFSEIRFNYLFFIPEVDNKLVMTETLDSGSTALVYTTFGAAVYDVEIATVVSNHPGSSHSMKEYQGGYLAEITVPDFTFHLQFTAKYSGQPLQRLSAPVIPRIGCPPLVKTTAQPSTLITKDKTVVSFTCQNECNALSHLREIVCDKGTWSDLPPSCSNAGYTCPRFDGPGNGTLLFKNNVRYSVDGATCGQSLEIHCNTYFDLVGEREAKCTSDGWENTDTKCANAQACPKLVKTTAHPSTRLTEDRTIVTFTCENECDALSHSQELVCRSGSWSEQPPSCGDAGYTCAQLNSPGNGSLTFNDQVVPSAFGARCGQSVQITCDSGFNLDGVTEAKCTPYGWNNKNTRCIGPGSSSDVPSSDVLGDWWLWIVIAVTAVLTITILTGITCVLIMRKGKKKEAEGRSNLRLPPETQALNMAEDLYEVVDSNGNYSSGCHSNGCQAVCSESLTRNRPPMPPPMVNSYGNLPSNMSCNPLYSRVGNNYQPISDEPISNNTRSNSLIYEEMQGNLPPPPPPFPAPDNTYDYATRHV